MAELSLLQKEITVPNPICNLMHIISGSNLESSAKHIKDERSKFKTQMSKGMTDQIYMVLPKKQRCRSLYAKKFSHFANQLKQLKPSLKPEIELRILRALRIQLCHEYCQRTLVEAQKDSVKIQGL